MKERSLLLRQPHADEMVRSILDGRKTQFRVPVKPQPPAGAHAFWTIVSTCKSDEGTVRFSKTADHMSPTVLRVRPPLGTVGDRLWVKETFGFSRQCDDVNEQERVVVYKACEPFHLTDAGVGRLKRCNSGCFMQPNHYVGTPSRWTPSIHMPRWASRIDLEITRVRVERVQDITEEDAKKEGVIPDDYEGYEHPDNPTLSCAAHRYSFRDLWQSIYGTWGANPFVWAYEFRRVKP